MRTDQLLFIAASRLPNECAPAGRALSFAMAAQHPSSIGYARLGTAYAANAGRCDRGYVNSLFADRMAGTTSLRDHRQRCDAAKGFFDAAELMRTADPAAALHDYTAAIAAVPTDDHCGYPWMASMAKADFEQHAGERAAARRTLAAAAAMKVGELRRDEALRRLAALDAAH